MGNNLFVFVFVIMISMCYADGESTGVISGTTEKIIMGVSNSTGSLDNTSLCSIRILYGDILIINYTDMDNLGGGLYNYTWDVPDDLGVYGFYFNCTTESLENYTYSGSVYVKQRILEKEVAVGMAKYGEFYQNRYINDQVNDDYNIPSWVIVLVVISVFVCLMWLAIHKVSSAL